MVNLLHHYETQSNRIFLLLEHVSGGQLVEHVQSIRDHNTIDKKKKRRRKRRKEDQRTGTDAGTGSGPGTGSGTGSGPRTGSGPETGSDPGTGSGTGTGSGLGIASRVVIGGECLPNETKESTVGGGEKTDPCPTLEACRDQDQYEEDLLAQLSALDPPSHPVLSSLTSVSTESDNNDEDSLTRLARIVKEDAAMHKIEEEEKVAEDSDQLAKLRRQLMESFDKEESDNESDDHHRDENGKVESKEEITIEEPEGNGCDDEERQQPEGEGLENDGLEDLERRLMAFVSKNTDEEKEKEEDQLMVGRGKDPTNPEGATSVSSSPDVSNSKSHLQELSDSSSVADAVTSQTTCTSITEEDSSVSRNNAGSDVIGTEGPGNVTQEGAISTSISVIPPTPTTATPLSFVTPADESETHQSSIAKAVPKTKRKR